jgi:glycosyltransferase involved in cell wall biosynthesis
MLLQTRSVARWLAEVDPDLLHCHLPSSAVVGRLAGRLAGIPVVYSEHNLQERYHPATRRLNRWTWGMQSAVVAVSGEVAESVGRSMSHSVPLRVVRNGIDFKRAASADSEGVRQSLRIPADVPVVGTVAVMRAQKRLDLWLEVASRVCEEVPETHFLIVGDGPLREQIEQIAGASTIAEVVHFVGLQDDVYPFLGAMDVFLMSSDHEGLPLALLEAMGCALAVVATRAGGIAEVIEDGVSGRLADVSEIEDLASGVVGLLRDPALRKAFGRAGRARVESEFSVGRMGRELMEVYREVLAR